MFPPGIEPGTICVLGRCDNHYTTETPLISCLLKTNSKFLKSLSGFSLHAGPSGPHYRNPRQRVGRQAGRARTYHDRRGLRVGSQGPSLLGSQACLWPGSRVSEEVKGSIVLTQQPSFYKQKQKVMPTWDWPVYLN